MKRQLRRGALNLMSSFGNVGANNPERSLRPARRRGFSRALSEKICEFSVNHHRYVSVSIRVALDPI